MRTPTPFRLTFALTLVTLLPTLSPAAAAPTTAPAETGKWVNISDPLVQKLTAEGVKIAYPGETAGVTVDVSTGDVFIVIPGRGLWKSNDQGKNFARVDEGNIGGRCETSFTINADPAGRRFACFMLDGKCAQTPNAGRTWLGFKDMGRNWDYAAVDWPEDANAPAQNIFAALHESGGKVHLSTDGGKSWRQLFADPEFDKTGGLGIFDDKTLVYTQKGKGIQRSTDAGATWKQVSDLEPTGRVVRVVKGTAYWLSKDGLLVSKDKGATWTKQGSPTDSTIGPFFDPKDERHIAAAGPKGIVETKDGGQTWVPVAPLPEGFKISKAGWFVNIAWDPSSGTYYTSNMGKPAYRWVAGSR